MNIKSDLQDCELLQKSFKSVVFGKVSVRLILDKYFNRQNKFITLLNVSYNTFYVNCILNLCFKFIT